MSESLLSLVDQKLGIEDHIRAIYGEVSEELEKQWQDTNIALKTKLDNYGEAIDDVNMTVTLLTDKKKKFTEKINAAINHLEKEVEKMKARLFKASVELEEDHLRGYNYSFHKFISQTKDFVDITKVEKEYRRYTLPKLNNYEFSVLMEALLHCSEHHLNPEIAERSRELNEMIMQKVSIDAVDLPKNHPSIIYKLKESVRIT